MKTIQLLKKIPIDLGQENVAETTEGKQIAKRLIKKGNGKKALDVGCRKGKQTKWLQTKGYKTTSIDIKKEYHKTKIIDANKKLPYKNNTYDLIWCSEVIEHLKNPQKTIQEFKRITKPKGTIILTTPNSHFWLYKILKPIGLTAQKLQRKDHLHYFHIKDIKKITKGKIYGYFPYIIIKKTLTNHKAISLLSPTFTIKIEVKK